MYPVLGGPAWEVTQEKESAFQAQGWGPSAHGALPVHLGHATPEGLPSEDAWSVHRVTIILGPPAGAIDVYVLRLQAEGCP